MKASEMNVSEADWFKSALRLQFPGASFANFVAGSLRVTRIRAWDAPPFADRSAEKQALCAHLLDQRGSKRESTVVYTGLSQTLKGPLLGPFVFQLVFAFLFPP